MSGFAVFIIVAAFFLIVSAGLKVLTSQLAVFKRIAQVFNNPFTGPLQALAREKSGSFVKAGNEPRAYFRSGGNSFIVKGRASAGKLTLTVSTFWHGTKFRLRLFHDKWTPGTKQFIGMQDLEIGSEEFDRRFVIQSDRQSDMLAVLTPPVQNLIMQSGSDINLMIHGGHLEFSRVSDRFDQRDVFGTVDQFMKLNELMLEGLFKTPAIELKVVESETANCMVCGDQIGDQRVDCRSCRTPHHKDCWEYLGVCSTYACGEKNYSSAADPRGNPDRFRIVE